MSIKDHYIKACEIILKFKNDEITFAQMEEERKKYIANGLWHVWRQSEWAMLQEKSKKPFEDDDI